MSGGTYGAVSAGAGGHGGSTSAGLFVSRLNLGGGDVVVLALSFLDLDELLDLTAVCRG
jgi:hypothetical protein